MSHIVVIETKIRDLEALTAATQRMRLSPPNFEEVQLFSSQAVGQAVRLPDWRYPVVCNTQTGQVAFDNYGGRWGKQEQLDQLFQCYAIEKTRIEARKQGHGVHEQTLQDGSVRLTLTIGDNA